MPNPRTANDAILANFRLQPAALAAVKKFARAKPWQGTNDEKTAKFNAAAAELCAAFEIAPVITIVFFENATGGAFIPGRNVIALGGKFSVVTFLYCFWVAKGHDKNAAHTWSLNVFKRCFPRSFAAARQDGMILCRD